MAQNLENSATFRFFGDLEVFLPPSGKDRDRPYTFNGNPAVKDAIEAQGVPHPEVALILANGQAVDFHYQLVPGDRVSVYPAFHSLPAPPNRLRGPAPHRFVLDVNLGKLARWLRLVGFDTIYRNDFGDAELAELSAAEDRIALTRDRRLLHQKQIVHGYWVRAEDPAQQIVEIMERFKLRPHVRPFLRCASCNGLVRSVPKREVLHLLKPMTRRYYQNFFQCVACRKVYWKGAHHDGLLRKLDRALRE